MSIQVLIFTEHSRIKYALTKFPFTYFLRFTSDAFYLRTHSISANSKLFRMLGLHMQMTSVVQLSLFEVWNRVRSNSLAYANNFERLVQSEKYGWSSIRWGSGPSTQLMPHKYFWVVFSRPVADRAENTATGRAKKCQYARADSFIESASVGRVLLLQINTQLLLTESPLPVISIRIFHT